MYIQEVIIKDLLPHSLQLLDQIGFEGGGPRASAGAEPMEGVVALNWHHQAAIQYHHHCIPHPLYQACTTEGAIAIKDKYEGLTGELLCEVTLIEGIMDQTKDLLLEINFSS